MIAVDSNVVLRLILQDDPEQMDLALAAMRRDVLFIPLTVLLEVGWVLQSRYRYLRAQIANALEALLTVDRIEVARPTMVMWAITRFRAGADLADVIHIVASAKQESFLTFDLDLTKRASELSPVPVELLA